jgi:hypothetical protein
MELEIPVGLIGAFGQTPEECAEADDYWLESIGAANASLVRHGLPAHAEPRSRAGGRPIGPRVSATAPRATACASWLAPTKGLVGPGSTLNAIPVRTELQGESY